MYKARPYIENVSPASFDVWLSRLFEGSEMTARKIRPSSFSVTGYVPTSKGPKVQGAESTLEQDFITLLEFDLRVGNYIVQPFKIRWRDSDGKQRRFTPDVAVRYTSHARELDPSLRTTIFEVKSRKFLKERWAVEKPRLRAGISWAKEYGCRFAIVTETEIRTPYLTNARFLMNYRSITGDPIVRRAREQHLAETLVRLGPTTPRDLILAISTNRDRQAEYIPYLWGLIIQTLIGVDLNSVLTMASPIWPTDGTRWMSERFV
ncbi:TnsA endonuclease N-terminal domain-containing protein (plasmid) [Pseudomonas sp. BYT-5]|uniref:TnsA endonuclease N-terminal domain-containing protein n=1 Tax=unclassified Pseudomonas TaxID=196821 RepID=UPI002021DA3F|nr:MULTISPECIES: TnsA endonuclease N-terminal domain-containing protein [unclassified Pseudomonas]URD45469.1 TnsA endonuclease N-terminal domain-containing protein [Pseudomonas sp. BYT-5]URL00706.1 TnsA endonuclease N-terminal domain-containing protein [Pseudomonas sp. BYT-1]